MGRFVPEQSRGAFSFPFWCPVAETHVGMLVIKLTFMFIKRELPEAVESRAFYQFGELSAALHCADHNHLEQLHVAQGSEGPKGKQSETLGWLESLFRFFIASYRKN